MEQDERPRPHRSKAELRRAASRKTTAAFRERQRDKGLTEITLWVPRGQEQQWRAAARKKREQMKGGLAVEYDYNTGRYVYDGRELHAGDTIELPDGQSITIEYDYDRRGSAAAWYVASPADMAGMTLDDALDQHSCPESFRR